MDWDLTRIPCSACAEFLQSRLDEEVSDLGFSTLPFRYAEISKVLLDVLVDSFLNIFHKLILFVYTVPQTISRIQIKYDLC